MSDSRVQIENRWLIGVPVITALAALVTIAAASGIMCRGGTCYGSGDAAPAGLGLLVVVVGSIVTGALAGSAPPAVEKRLGSLILAWSVPYALLFAAVADGMMGGGPGDYLAVTISAFGVGFLVFVVVMVLGAGLFFGGRGKL